jgi:CDP-glucose 4,6-dehydratase
MTDMRDQATLEKVLFEVKPNYIFHLAAQPLVLKSYEKPIETFETNILGTAYLLNYAITLNSVKKIVVATTDKVYKNFEDGRKYSENDALEGMDPYSASKVGVEAAVKSWQTISAGRNSISISSVRAGNVIGGGDFASNRLLPDLVRGYLDKSTVTVRNPRSTRPWQHVLDPIIGYVKVAENSGQETNVQSFNFGPKDESLSVMEVCKIAEETLGLKIEFAREMIKSNHEATLLNLDSSKARELLNWNNLWSQQESVSATLNWWKSVCSGELSATEACARDLNFAAALTAKTE